MNRLGSLLSSSTIAIRRTRRSLVIHSVAAAATVSIVGKVVGKESVVMAQDATPDSREIEMTVQRLYDALNSGDVDALDDILAPNWEDFPPPPGPGTDVENYKQVILGFRAAFPDGLFTTRDFIVEGNQVAVRSIGTGTHQGDFYGVPSTGRSVEFQTIDIHRVEAGRIVETYHVEDLLSVLTQVGGFPPTGSGSATPTP